MSTSPFALLDQTELLQLAVNAGASEDAGAAIAYLKEAASRPDASAIAHFLLGAEYAQATLYERAIDAMEAALALDPSLAIARFQLGLLCLTMGDAARAASLLQPLAELPESDALRHFGQGLCELIADAYGPSVDSLRRGLVLNDSNPMLSVDMQKIIDQILALPQMNGLPDAVDAAASSAVEAGGRHILLSAYTDNKEH